MGDRVNVSVIIPSQYKEKIEKLDGFNDYSSIEEDQELELIPISIYTFEEVNYAELDFESDLIEMKIPFTKDWEAGCEFGSGSLNSRISADGEQIVTELYDDERGVMPVLEVKEALQNGKLDELQMLVDKYIKETVVMGWQEQKEIIKENPKLFSN